MFNWNEAFNKTGFECEIHDIDNIVDPSFAKQLRKKFNVSQRLFARILGISEKTVEKWEQGANPIKGPASRLLFLLDKYEFLINDFYEIKKNDEYYETRNEYQIRVIAKKEKIIKNNNLRYIEKTTNVNKELLKVREEAC